MTNSHNTELKNEQKNVAEIVRELQNGHVCRFNDGEQRCDCFAAGMEAILPAYIANEEKLAKAIEILENNQEPNEKGERCFYYCNECGGNKEIEQALAILRPTPPANPTVRFEYS